MVKALGIAVVVRILAALGLIALTLPVMATPQDFFEAKRYAERVYADHPEEFYCGCRINWRRGGKDLVDLKSCGYQVRRDPVRAQRVEWEHVVPASWFGKPMACCRQGGRENCSRRDPVFQRMEADLHNLTPSIGEVNGDRGNFPFGSVAADKARYGRCATRVDLAAGRVEPRDAVKGDVARIAFYMAQRYQVRIDQAQLALLVQWAQQDPVDAWERERDRRIGQFMGWRNPFVAQTGKIPLPSVGQVSVTPAVPLPLKTLELPPRAGVEGRVPAVGGNPLQAPIHANRSSRVFHLPHCPGYGAMKPENRLVFASLEEALAQGYRQAGNCH